MVDRQHWQLDGNAPELFQRYLLPAITAKWAEDIIDRTRPQAGARLASRRISQGHVTGLDLNKGMLAVAWTLPREGAPIDWIEASALDLPFPAGQFDLVLCQQGLQFFLDQGRALREMRRVLSPSGRVALSVYSPIERTPGANAFISALDRVLGLTASKIKRAEHSKIAVDRFRLFRGRSPDRRARNRISIWT
jgi:SAM-dependent methyltransferase